MARSRELIPLFLLAVASGLASCAAASRTKAHAPSHGSASSASIGEAVLADRAKRRDGAPETGSTSLIAVRTKPREAKLDGRLDPNLRLEQLGPGVRAAFSYDDEALNIFLHWTDAGTHRLNVAFPDERGVPIVRSVYFAHSSKDGNATRAVDDEGKLLEGITTVDTEEGDGVESRIPWVLFPEGERTRVGLSVSLETVALQGVTPKGAGTKKASRSASTAPRTPVLMASERALRDDLLRARLLPEDPLYMRVADLCGDDAKELVLVYPGLLAIVGSSYGGGERFFYRELGEGTEVRSIDVRPITGRAKSDVILTLAQGAREWVEIESFLAGENPTMVFAQTVALGPSPERILNRLRIGHEREIEISTDSGTPFSVDGDDYQVPSDVRPPILPWGGIERVLFRFDGQSFRMEKEFPRKTKPEVKREATAAPTRAETIEHPAEPRSGLEQYLAERRLPSSTKAERSLPLKLSRGASAMVTQIGTDLVLHGGAVGAGRQYVRITLPIPNADDVLAIDARDVTGDGDDDLLVRMAKDLRTDGKDSLVRSEQLLVFAYGTGTLARVFAAELARQSGDRRVEGNVHFASKSIELSPGTAAGWTESSYAWAQEKQGGPLAPLLLPWSGIEKFRYEWRTDAFVAVPSKPKR